MRDIPHSFLEDVEVLISTLAGFFNKELNFDDREKLLIPYFDLLFFQKVIERYFDDTYVITWRLFDRGEIVCSLLTLDASNHLTDIYREKSPAIFFSFSVDLCDPVFCFNGTGNFPDLPTIGEYIQRLDFSFIDHPYVLKKVFLHILNSDAC